MISKRQLNLDSFMLSQLEILSIDEIENRRMNLLGRGDNCPFLLNIQLLFNIICLTELYKLVGVSRNHPGITRGNFQRNKPMSYPLGKQAL
jgi:hypothetical protein